MWWVQMWEFWLKLQSLYKTEKVKWRRKSCDGNSPAWIPNIPTSLSLADWSMISSWARSPPVLEHCVRPKPSRAAGTSWTTEWGKTRQSCSSVTLVWINWWVCELERFLMVFFVFTEKNPSKPKYVTTDQVIMFRPLIGQMCRGRGNKANTGRRCCNVLANLGLHHSC